MSQTKRRDNWHERVRRTVPKGFDIVALEFALLVRTVFEDGATMCTEEDSSVHVFSSEMACALLSAEPLGVPFTDSPAGFSIAKQITHASKAKRKRSRCANLVRVEKVRRWHQRSNMEWLCIRVAMQETPNNQIRVSKRKTTYQAHPSFRITSAGMIMQ